MKKGHLLNVKQNTKRPYLSTIYFDVCDAPMT